MRIDCLGDGEYFEFSELSNLNKSFWKNLRVKRVTECSVSITGEFLSNKSEDTWQHLNNGYSISCSTEVTRIKPPANDIEKKIPKKIKK